MSAAFAWEDRTDITTWIDPPATFQLNGPFVEGTQGTTLMPGQDRLTWWIRDVHAGSSFAIEMPLDRATLRFEWHVVPVSEQRTKLTQRIILSGSNATAYREQLQTGFGSTLAAGMARMSADMVAAERIGRLPANFRLEPTRRSSVRSCLARGSGAALGGQAMFKSVPRHQPQSYAIESPAMRRSSARHKSSAPSGGSAIRSTSRDRTRGRSTVPRWYGPRSPRRLST